MRFTVSRDLFYQAVTGVSKATATRVVQPILSNILIEATGGASPLVLSATDLDFSLQTSINAEIAVAGRTTISGRKLSDILAKLPPKAMVEVDVDQELQTCKVSCGSASFELRTLPAEEFPLIPTVEPSQAVELPLESLVRAIRQSEYAASKSDTTNILGGIFFKLTNEALELVATDGSRLARRKETLSDVSLAEPLSAIIPCKTLAEFMKLATSFGIEADEKVLVGLQQGQVFLTTTRFSAASRLLDGQYPRYEQLIPRECKLQARMNRASLGAALDRAAVMASDRTHIVKLSFVAGQVTLVADTPDVGNSKDSLPVHYEGEAFNIAFNYKFVQDALKVMDGDDVVMETNGSLAPTLFKDDKELDAYLCLVMPVQAK